MKIFLIKLSLLDSDKSTFDIIHEGDSEESIYNLIMGNSLEYVNLYNKSKTSTLFIPKTSINFIEITELTNSVNIYQAITQYRLKLV